MALHGKEVLIIDDDKNFRILLTRVLTNAGLVVRESKSVQDAFREIQERVPHFIFLDMNMPEESGLVFLEKKNKNPVLRDIPVLVLTAHSESELVHKALSNGASEYLLKPLNTEILLKKLRKLSQDAAFIQVKVPEAIQCQVAFKGELLGMNTQGIQLTTAIKFKNGHKIKMNGRIDSLLKSKEVNLESVSEGSHFSGQGKHISWMKYISFTQAQINAIATVTCKWNQIVSNHPKETKGVTFPTVLILDDDDNFNALIGKLLSKLGFKPEAFNNSAEFLERVKKGHFDACLIDLNLETARVGFKIVEEIRASQGPYLPVYVVSGESDHTVIAQALELGCDGYIVKSVDAKTLSEKLAEFLLSKSQLNENLKTYQIPTELSQVQIYTEIQLLEVDELGVKFGGALLPAKGTAFTLFPSTWQQRPLNLKPLSFTVTRNWVDSKTHSYGFYAEAVEATSEYSLFLRNLAAIASGAGE
jgi:CheY-like chemotaxis protein